MLAPWAGPILDGPPLRVPWGRRSCRPPGPCPPSLGLLCPPGACARYSRGRWSWNASAGAGAVFPGRAAPALPGPRLPWAGPPGRLDRARGRLRRGRCSRRGSDHLPPRFSPRFPAGISPVTRAAGDSPAHNARPRRSPRNARSINHSDMKSTIFVKLRLHKTVDFCNITSIFAKFSQKPRKYFQFPLLSVNYGSSKPLPLGRKKSAAPFLERRSFNLVIFIFNLVMCAVNGAIFTLWARSAPLTCTLAPPGTAQRRRGNCTTTVGDHRNAPGNHREPHDYGGELHKSGWELYKNLQSENRRDIIGNKWKATGWGAAQTLPSLSVG